MGGRYRLLDQLGKGGMGSVYRAFDRLTGQEIALKRILANDDLFMASSYIEDSSHDPRLSLAREFQALASLRHPNIIGVLDYGFDDKRQSLISRWMFWKTPKLSSRSAPTSP